MANEGTTWLAMSIKVPDPHFKVSDFEEVYVDYAAPDFEVGTNFENWCVHAMSWEG